MESRDVPHAWASSLDDHLNCYGIVLKEVELCQVRIAGKIRGNIINLFTNQILRHEFENSLLYHVASAQSFLWKFASLCFQHTFPKLERQ